MLSTLIVGFGKSGRSLHLPSLMHARRLTKGEAIFADTPPAVVDPAMLPTTRERTVTPVILMRSLDETLDLDPSTTVAHICAPPTARACLIEQLGSFGFTRIICEKPVATSVDELHAILRVAKRQSLDIAVVSPWLSSALTARLIEVLDEGRLGALRSIHVTQDKPRFTRTRDRIDHPSAFEIEVPHSLGFAMRLAGPLASIDAASVEDMELEEGIIFPGFGAATLTVTHRDGVRTRIESCLTSPVRRRSVVLELELGEVHGHYPVSGADTYAQMTLRPLGQPPAPPEILLDEQLTRMLIDWYGYFAGVGPRPVSDLAFNVTVTDAICRAKQLSGLSDVERMFRPPPLEAVLG